MRFRFLIGSSFREILLPKNSVESTSEWNLVWQEVSTADSEVDPDGVHEGQYPVYVSVHIMYCIVTSYTWPCGPIF